MKRTPSSKAWMRRHVTDRYVRLAKHEGYRSRAAYKLLQIDARDRLFAPGMTVVDLGAAPGGWSQVAAERVGPAGRVIALDILPIEPIPGVAIVRGDFCSDGALVALEDLLAGRKADVVISDMAPNLSGVPVADQARSAALAELALDFTIGHLQPRGRFLVKAFQGEAYSDLVKAVRAAFASVATRKPAASRDGSSEVYLLGASPILERR